MKKKALYGIVASVMTMTLTSCGSDFLSEEPSSSLPLEGYYNTEARMQESLVAAYDPLQWPDYFNGWCPLQQMWDSQGDDLYVGGGSTSDQSQLHLISQYKSDPNNSIGGLWSTCYSGINRSIHLIDNATANLNNCLTAEVQKQYIAEGRVLRALYYLWLWKTWGNVVLYMENLTFPYEPTQVTADEVYNTIVPDLEDVLDSKALPMRQTDEWAGRITQAAAAMIYADYVMYQGDKARYPKALAYMKEIINSGKYALIPGDRLDDLSSYDMEWNSETIFDIDFQALGGKRDWGSANATGGTVLPALCGIDGLGYQNGVGTAWGPYTEFNTGGWGFYVVAKETYDAYDPNDLRRDCYILNMAKYQEEMAAQGITVKYGGRYQNTGYFIREYLGRPHGNEGNVASGDLNWDNNIHLYRYAETLLNAAELGMETGDAAAQDYFDQVRQRAGLSPKSLTMDNIIDERHFELVGQGKRYFDLVRSGKAATVLKAGAGVVLQNKNPLTWGGKAVPERPDWTPNKKYLPIPQGEIEAARGKIVQNPY